MSNNLSEILSELKHHLGNKATNEIKQLIEENNALKLAGNARGEGVDFTELTRHGDDWQQYTMAKYLGEYNPDEIPLNTYDKMRWDGQLRLGLMTIKLPIMSRSFWIDCEDKDIQAFVQQNMKEIWRPFIKSILNALDFGFAPHEKVWEIAENYRVVNKSEKIDYTKDLIRYRSIKDVCQKTITIDYTEKMKFNGFWQNKRKQNQVYVKPDKAFVFTHDKEWGNIYGWSRLKPAYPYWYTYWILDAWHERWLQKRGIPPVIVKYPIGKSQIATSGSTPSFKDNQEIARDAAKSMQPDSIVTIPSDEIKTPTGRTSMWDIVTLQDNTRIDAFVQAKELLDIRKLRSILVPERAVTQDSSTGSYKMAETHVWIMMESLKGLIGDIASHTNEFLISQLVKVNFGENAPIATMEIEEIGKELTSALFEIYLGLVQSGKAHPGIKKMEELLNIPSETDEEKTERQEREEKLQIPPQVTQHGFFPEEKKFYDNKRESTLTDRVRAKFLERELNEKVEKEKKELQLSEELNRKKTEVLDAQLNLTKKYLGV